MPISPRTQSLVNRLPDHPLSASMKDAMIAALAASEQFSGHKIGLASDRRMTELGKSQALKDELTNRFGKQLARAKAVVTKARAEIDAERAALVIKPVDKTDIAAALERQEIRAWIRQLDLGVRQSVVLATKDVRILEAVTSAPPELSGFAGDAAFASKVEDRYIELTYPDKLADIEAKSGVVAEAEASMHISRNDMRATVDMHQRDFDALMKPVEVIRPVLTSDRKQLIEIDAAGRASYRPASQSDIDNGIVFGSDEHKAAQAA
jgi:hypothetical protein